MLVTCQREKSDDRH